MTKYFTILFFALSFFIIEPVRTQTKEDNQDFSRIVQRFIYQQRSTLQEKVYLQTDKPYYSAGEDIWFKAYLVNSVNTVPESLSNFIYVELIDKSDSVLTRVKIRKDSLGFSGNIHLKPEIPAGNYVLRAYTYWMQNIPVDFFFKKNIYIGNSIDDRISCQISYGTPENMKIPVQLTFTSTYGSPLKDRKILISQNRKSAGRKNFVLITNAAGKVFWKIDQDSTGNSVRIISVSINDADMKYNKKFYVPVFSNDFDVQFFPESGSLINDYLQTIAFKAIGTDGLSVEVNAKLYNDKNEELCEFSSSHKGMGKFVFQTKLGESYYAIVESATGKVKRFNLPKVQASGVAIQIGYNKNRLLYKVENHTNIPSSALCLLVHSRGAVLLAKPLLVNEGFIYENNLPAGIVSFAVVDSSGTTYCERLAFVRNFNLPEINMNSDQKIYGKREPVNLDFNIKSATGENTTGFFAVSVTDSKIVKTDSLSDNILSYLLLSSDLKGYIEDPAEYFTDNSVSTREKTDILMLTQGWKRFSTSDVAKGKFSKPSFYIEAGQTLSGKVLNILNKPTPQCDISMFTSYRSFFKLTKTDSLGNYLIDGIEFPDSTGFILKARKKKLFGDVELLPDKDVFPPVSVFIPTPKAETETPPADYFQQIKEKYYNEGGMMVVNLDELTVNAERKKVADNNEFYVGMADTQITSETLERNPTMSIMNVLQTVPGVMITGENISIRGSNDNPLILIDGIEAQGIEDITYLTANDVENISVFKGPDAAIFGIRGGSGVIAISLRKGVALKATTPISLVRITPLGYQKPTEFYVPKYEVDSIRSAAKPDLRTTIYWNPKLTTDSNGNIHVHFFTADKANDYSVVLEGITKAGEICRFNGKIRRN